MTTFSSIKKLIQLDKLCNNSFSRLGHLAIGSSNSTSAGLLVRKFSLSSAKMATDAKTASYKLKYFNFRVLGEPIRWQFALAGVPFEDIRLPRDTTWDAENKPKLGWGRLPLLIINNETEITQSCAISRYLAKSFGLMPECPMLQARCDELVDNLQDLRLLWRPFARESNAEKKAVLEKEMLNIHFPFYLPKVQHFLRQHGKNGFAVGDKLSWADLYLANFTEIWTDVHGDKLFGNYPLLTEHKNKILAIPQIKEWNSKRPVSKF